jgi:hypothetical protein
LLLLHPCSETETTLHVKTSSDSGIWTSYNYEGRLKSSWTGGSAPLLCRGRQWLLYQAVVVGLT